MDVDLAMLFPSDIWQHSLPLSPSLLCEEWTQLIMGIRISSGEYVLARDFFSLWCPLLPTSVVSWVFHILQAQSHLKAQARSSFSPPGCTDQITPRGFPLLKLPAKYFAGLKLRYQTISQLWPVWTKGCYEEMLSVTLTWVVKKKPQMKALNRRIPAGQFLSFSFLLWV